MKKRISTLDLLAKLVKDETAFLDTEFIAPRIAGDVGVKIGEAVCQMRIKPRGYHGWGVFRPIDYRSARFVRVPTDMERERYLSAMPLVRMLITGRDDHGYMGVQTHHFGANVVAKLWFAEGPELFDSVVTRFDGMHFVYDGPDNGRGLMYAERLREALANDEPEAPAMPGLLPQEKWLYREALIGKREAMEKERKGKAEYRLADALSHAGAVMRSYVERNDGYVVEFMIGKHKHSSFVDKNLRVHSAGLCLSGRDHDYDLASLVSVIREGQEKGRVNVTRVDTERRGENNEYQYGFEDRPGPEEDFDDDDY